MNTIHSIHKVKEYLEKEGLTVTLYARLPKSVSGRIYYTKRMVKLNRRISPTLALLSLIHEGGHWLSYTRYFLAQDIDITDYYTQELLAYTHGWYLIRQLQIPLTKIQWKNHHKKIDRIVFDELYGEAETTFRD